MLTMQEIKNHYFFTDEDADILRSLRPLAEKSQERFADEFYDYLLSIPQTAEIIKSDLVLQRHKKTHQAWFINLFSGVYDNQYVHILQRIGHAHVKAGVSAHFVSSAMTLVRHFAMDMIQENYPDRDTRRRICRAVDKIIDMNLDLIGASYREEEMKKVFLSHRLESKLIHATERFTYGLNLILVIALSGVSISVVLLFVWDIVNIFRGDIEKGILSALGSLLILWMMIELMDNEIKTLKGGRFNILVFIGVIIVALIREILISTLRHDAIETQTFLAGTLLILGTVYFLVAKSQQISPSA